MSTTSLADFRWIVELNLTGTFLGIRTAGRHLADGGSVVNISSLNGVLATAELGAYVASKFAVSATPCSLQWREGARRPLSVL